MTVQNDSTGAAAMADAPSADRIAFGSFSSRFRAVVVDAVVLAFALVAIVLSISVTEAIPGAGRVGVFLMAAVLVFYEPFLVAWRGATVGHMRANLRVVYDRTGERPGFVRAFVRYVIKSIFGAASFLLMALTRRHQALHDRLTGTTVRIHDRDVAREADIAWERSADELEPSGSASRARRVVVILGYLVLLLILLNVLASVLLSDACLVDDGCSPAEHRIQEVLGLLWLAANVVCIVAGWRGHLWGCRPRKSVSYEVFTPDNS